MIEKKDPSREISGDGASGFEFYSLSEYWDLLRRRAPLVHCITNYVTVNDCANILLAAGASPVMADSPEEVREITTLADALTVNIGTLNAQTISGMSLAAQTAQKQGKPAVLDPVGAGASSFRTSAAERLLASGAFSLFRGNASELRALAGESFRSRGVDASKNDQITSGNLSESVSYVRQFALDRHCVAAVSGPIDIISDGHRTALIRNGVPLMSRVTGAGCMLSVLCAAFLGAVKEKHLYFEAVTAAVCALGVCGEIAAARLTEGQGNAAFRIKLIDAVCCLDGSVLDRRSHVEFIETEKI